VDPLLERLKVALAGRYAVEHELGRGGMAVVYLGRDLRLDRRVAIKVFEAEGRGGQVTERFLREIRIAAQLQHPNILAVFESGEAEGLVYYIMPYVAGQSLRERLEKEGPLPVADAVRIAREVAEALDHAHQAGIVHRDIKPDNILLASGVAVVMDFGIARALQEAGGGKLTDTGLAIGTPTYMSPEQATASPLVDGRADIYALGCVLYEMLAGAPPFSGPTAQAVMARHSADAVPPLSTVREVPPALEAAVVKALAKAPADRWPTGKAFAEALEETGGSGDRGIGGSKRRPWVRVGIGVGAALVVAATWLGVWRVRAAGVRAGDADSHSSVAVLPFRIIGDTAQAALADGLTEAVITGLVRAPGLRVPATSRVFAYRDRLDDVREVGRELGVASVVSATVQLAGGTLRVTAELISVGDGVVRWRERFDGEMSVNGELQDIFTIQDAITVRIVDALQVRLAPASRAALARGVRTRDPEAYNLYLQARRATYELTKPSLERAITLLEQALERDSTFADAWVGLADAYSWSADYLPTADLAAAWRRAVERAIDLDSLNGFAYALRGELRHLYDWDWDGARRDMRHALRLAPASADVALSYVVLLNLLSDPESAVVHMRRAVALDPANPVMWANLGTRLAMAGAGDSALAASEHALSLDSTLWFAHIAPMVLHLDAGRRDEADSAAVRLLRFGEDRPFVLSMVASHYRRTGDRQRAREILDRLSALARRQYVPATSFSQVRLAVGDRSGALDALEEAARNHNLNLPVDLFLLATPLGGEPRYEAVRARVFGDRPVGWPTIR